MYFVYILYSEAFDKYYVGHTNSINHRQTFNTSSSRVDAANFIILQKQLFQLD